MRSLLSLFFVGVITVVGTKWLASEPGAGQAPMSRVMAGAFVGLFIGALVFGLILFNSDLVLPR